VIAMMIAIPVGPRYAMFLTETMSQWLRRAAIGPIAVGNARVYTSIIYGMWGLFVLGPPVHGHTF